MSDKPESPLDATEAFTEMLRIQGEAAREAIENFAPGMVPAMPEWQSADTFGSSMFELQQKWLNMFMPHGEDDEPAPPLADPAAWLVAMRQMSEHLPMLDADRQRELWSQSVELWSSIIDKYSGTDAGEEDGKPDLPRKDRRFSDPAWQSQPVFALIHQTYLFFAERLSESVDSAKGLSDEEREQMRFATKTLLDAMSPANFPMTNPVVLERTLETQGQNLVTGMERLAHDLEAGQLTHTDTSQFTVGENIAATPGKVIYETELFQLIQYTPTTEKVLAKPLLIFPPWINRFYILDLNAKKSFVQWAVGQGITVLMVSWKSADESLAHIGWDDYIMAQIEAIDVVCERLKVPSIHTIGYCVAGTNLAMTLAVLARRGEADKVASATFLTAQVDFSHAGDLCLFVDDGAMQFIKQASKGGYFDGRYMAATFNMLRGSDLIWDYVVNHYLLGKDYPAFDLLFWNGDVTNLPVKWHEAYLRDLYRDNLLIVPDKLSADGTPIDLRLVETPVFIQAGRDDHIAPAKSVFEITRHFSGPARFMLAGSGHIAGVVNPPASKKYQYWTASGEYDSLEDFQAAAEEHPGSWWPYWCEWLKDLDPETVKATGRRKPGGKSNPAIEDAPGRYVKMR